jgi:Holliday junction DNA helicase RuvB
MINKEYVDQFFPDIIGQDKVKSEIAFYLTAFSKTQLLPHLLFIGGKGGGKTAIATLTAKNLRVPSKGNTIKPLIKVNCATIRKLERMVESVLIPYVKDHCTVFFDEAHALDPIAQEALLTVLNPDKNNVGYMNYKDSVLEFDFKKVSFIFATTDPQKLSNPLKDRLCTIQLEAYKNSDLAKICKINAKGVDVDEALWPEIASVCRGNPRAAVKMAQEKIIQYAAASGSNIFDAVAWGKMKEVLGINPLGVGEGELQILRCLDINTTRSLTSISASTGLEKSAIMHQFEIYLLKCGLIEVAQKGRKLTQKGVKYLQELDNINKNA